jgi:hypothetical protein
MLLVVAGGCPIAGDRAGVLQADQQLGLVFLVELIFLFFSF